MPTAAATMTTDPWAEADKALGVLLENETEDTVYDLLMRGNARINVDAYFGLNRDAPDPETYRMVREDPGMARAVRAVEILVEMMPPSGHPIESLPALIQDEHGCWMTDPDDAERHPDIRMGCAVAWGPW